MSKIVTETLQLKNLQKKKKKTSQTKEIKKRKNKLSNKKKRNSKETKSNSCGSNKKENFQQQKITKIETNVEEEQQQQQQQQEQLLLHDSNSNNSNNTNNKEEEELEAEELQLQQRRQQQQLYQSQLSPNYFQYLRKNQTALPLLITTTTTRTATTTTKTHAATDDIKNNNKHNINNKTKKKKAKIHTKNEIIDEEEFFFDDDHNNNNNNDGEQRLFDDDKDEDKDEEKKDDNSNSKSVENAVHLNCLRDREQVEQKTKSKSPIKTIAATSTASAKFADQVLFAASLSAENMPLSQGHYTSKSAFAATKRASIKASRLNNDESLSKQRKSENAQDNKGNNNNKNQLHSRFNNNNNNFFSNFNNHKQSSSNNNNNKNNNHPNQQCQNLLNSSTKQPLFTSSTTTTTSSTFSTPHLQLLSTGIYQCKKNNNSNNNKNDSHSNNNTIKQNIQFSYCVGESLARYGRLQEAFDIYALIASKQLDGSVPLDRLGALVTCLITYMRQLNKKLQTDYDSNVNAAGVRRKFGVDVEPSGAAAAAAAAASLTTAPSIAEAIAIVDVDAESLDLFQTKSSHHNSPYANVFSTKTALLANTNEDYDPLLCTLCSDILRCPVTANCGHTFCRQCCEVITMCNICHVKFPRIVFDDFAVLPTTTTTAAAISTSAAAPAAAATTTSIAAFANFNCRSNGGGNQTLLRGGLNSFNNFDTTVAPPTTTQQSNNALQESGSGGGSDSSRSGNGVVAFNTGTGGNFMSQTSSSSLSSASMSSSSANSGSGFGFASSSSSLSTTLSSSSHYTRAVTTSTVSLTTATATTTMASTPSTIMRGGNGNGNIGSESSGGSGLSPGSLRSNGNSNSFKFMTDVTVRRLVEKWWGPDLQAQKISETAASHMHLNLLDDALKFCNASLEKSPTNFKSLLLRGEVLRKLNHFQSSLSDVDNALRVRYTSAKAHYLRALILSDLGRIDEALFENCLAISLDRATNLSGSEIFQHDLAKNLQKLLAQTPKSKVSLVMPRNCIGALPYSILAEHRLRRKQSLVLSNAADYNLNCLEREYVTCPADLGVKSCDFISADEDFLIDNEYAVVDREAHEVVAAYNDCELMTLRRPTSRKHFRRKWAPKETELMPTTMALSDARCSVLFRGVLERTQQELQRLKKLEVSGGDSQKKQLMQVPQNLIDASDFDCVLCCRTFWKPVVTPCGHTYCLVCLDRCMDYTSSCPLCMSPLVEPSNGGGAANMFQGSSPSPVPFMLAKRSVTKFLEAAMKRFIPESYDKRFRQEMDLEPTVPLFICTTAFPYVPCPLFVYEPRYRLMVRRAVESGQKHFGIVQPHSGKSRYFDVGTILDIRDCVLLGDGCSILSTIGCKRFKILARNEKDGYETAKVEYIYDEMIADENVPFVMNMHAAVLTKAIDWFDSLSVDLKQEIFQSFGEMPPLEENWESIADGPAWAWWIIALLPLSQQLKVDILATTSLEKRLRAIEKTLDYLSGTFQRTQQNCGVVVVQQQQQQHNQQQHQQCNEHNNSQQQQQQQQNTQDECCQRTNSMMMGDG